MKTVDFVRYALSSCVAVAFLTGCGGSQSPIEAPGATGGTGDSPPHQKTFHYTGARQSFTVPTGVSSINIVALGSEGAGGTSGCPHGGLGGRVSAVIPVEPQERLVVVGGGEGAAGFSSQTGAGGGGGGGSSFIEPSASNVKSLRGKAPAGNGEIKISW